MQWVENWDLFLLDMDGLLVDTERLHQHSYQETCVHYGAELPWDLATYCRYAHESQDRLRKELYRAYPHLSSIPWDQFYDHKRAAYQRLLEGSKIALMPGVAQLLTSLQQRNQRHCVVTHSRIDDVEMIRAQHPLLQAIPHWITREDYKLPKPHPEGYLLACSRYGKSGDRVIGFEDAPRGILALLAAEATPVWVCPFDHPDLDHSRYTSFEEIPAAGP
jgi:beta-phosphoglucomutase